MLASLEREEAHSIGFRRRYGPEEQLPTLVRRLRFERHPHAVVVVHLASAVKVD